MQYEHNKPESWDTASLNGNAYMYEAEHWAGGCVAPLNKNWGGLVPKNTFTDVFDNTCDISYFRANIFCPKTT